PAPAWSSSTAPATTTSSPPAPPPPPRCWSSSTRWSAASRPPDPSPLGGKAARSAQREWPMGGVLLCTAPIGEARLRRGSPLSPASGGRVGWRAGKAPRLSERQLGHKAVDQG